VELVHRYILLAALKAIGGTIVRPEEMSCVLCTSAAPRRNPHEDHRLNGGIRMYNDFPIVHVV
jgi:hypothetical protein